MSVSQHCEVPTESEMLAELITGESYRSCLHLSSISLSQNLTAVSYRSLMEAPGPTIAHYSLLLLSLHSRSHQGQIGFTVAHLSRSARWHLCYRERERKVCVCLKGVRGWKGEKDRMTAREVTEIINARRAAMWTDVACSRSCYWLIASSIAPMWIQ